MSLPESFCWTRFGTEAGQPIDEILGRKEQERLANGGTFLWGIGNAVGPSIRELVRRTRCPEVLFSPVKSAPRLKDVSPPAVAAWTSAVTLEGDLYALPDRSLVTSAHDPAAPRDTHYALVCFSSSPLVPSRGKKEIALVELRNLLSGRPVAASQTTAVVQRNPDCLVKEPGYEVAIRASLTPPYFLTLRDPLPLAHPDLHPNWTEVVQDAWQRSKANHPPRPLRLSFPEA